MMEMLKPFYSLKAISLGWSLVWRAFLVGLLNIVILGLIGFILIFLLSSLGSVVTTILAIIGYILYVALLLASYGWAVMRIKDKL
jgi:hypothetical protein